MCHAGKHILVVCSTILRIRWRAVVVVLKWIIVLVFKLSGSFVWKDIRENI